MKYTGASLLALLLAAGSDAKVIKECNEKGQIAFLVDGITKSATNAALKTLQEENVLALVSISQNMLSGQDMKKFVHEIKKGKHSLAYRFTTSDKEKLHQLTDKAISADLERAKARFADLHNVDLKFVVFDYTEDSNQATRLRKLAEKAGLTIVAHNLYLGNRLSDAKATIKDNIFNPTGESYIVMVETNKMDKVEAIKAVMEHANNQSFTVTSFGTCAAVEGEKSIEEEDDDDSGDLMEGKKEKPGVKKTKNKKKRAVGVKKNVLVNPNQIRGYKKWAKKNKRGSSKKSSKRKSDPKRNTKLYAKKNKDTLGSDPDKLVNPDKKEPESGKTEAQSAQAENGASALAVPSMAMIMAVVVGALALF